MCHAHLALRLALSFAMSDLRAFQLPRTGYHACSFYCTFCIISAPPSHPSGTKKRQGLKCSRAKHASRTRDFALRLALSLAMSDLRAFQSPRTGYHERSFYCTFCIISIPPSHLPAQKKHRGFKCSRSKHAHHGSPCGLSLAWHGRRTSVNADRRS